MTLAANGDLYVGGEFESGAPVRAHNLTRWDGRAWPALGPGLNGPVQALAWAPSNRLLAAVLDPAACQPRGKRPVLPQAAPGRR
jgi:hypothetical protein